MSFRLTILGSSSAKPAFGRFTTSQYLDTESEAFLIDAGEGLQIQLNKYRLKPNRISHIFISHLHGDHILGLPGFLTSLNLNSRTKALKVFSPPGLKNWFNSYLSISESALLYPIEFIELNEDKDKGFKIYSSDQIEVTAFPVIHRVSTFGFRFDQKKDDFNIDPKAITKYSLTIDEIKSIKSGMDLIREGKRISFEELVLPKKKNVSYAFCTDSVYSLDYIDAVKGVDLLYHEATYLKDLELQAKERMHCTAQQAGIIAKKANVKKLIIGHYSCRYRDLAPLLSEVREEFESSFLAMEGEEHIIKSI